MAPSPDGVPPPTLTVLAFNGFELPAQYQNMVLSKWMRTLRYGNEYFKLIDSDAYYASYRTYITTMLAKQCPTFATVRLALLTEDKDICLGWSVTEDSILHYVYVASEQRGRGLARLLVPQNIDTFTHLTKTGMSLWNTKAKEMKFNPFA